MAGIVRKTMLPVNSTRKMGPRTAMGLGVFGPKCNHGQRCEASRNSMSHRPTRCTLSAMQRGSIHQRLLLDGDSQRGKALAGHFNRSGVIVHSYRVAAKPGADGQ